MERLVYRTIAFPQIKAGLGLVGEQLAFIERQQPWGPGRVDTFNPYKAIQFGFPMTPETLDPVALDGDARVIDAGAPAGPFVSSASARILPVSAGKRRAGG